MFEYRRKRRANTLIQLKTGLCCMHQNTIEMTSEGFPMLYCLDCKQIIDKNKQNRGDWSKDYFPVNVSPYNDIGFFDARPIDKIDYYS